MAKPPDFFDYLFILAFFVIGNGGTLLAARRKARRTDGPAWPMYYITAAPLFWFFTYSSWLWLSDMTANNLWPLALIMFAVPTALCWLVLDFMVRRSRQSE